MNSRGYLEYDWHRATLLSGGGYTTAKSPLVENIIHGCKNDMDANMATLS